MKARKKYGPQGLLLLAMMLGGCGDVRFSHPERLWLLWLVPLAVFFIQWSERRRTQLMQRFAEVETLKRIASSISGFRRSVKSLLMVLALVGLLVAVSGPKWGFAWEEIHRRGVDVIIALDVSDSMLVEDAGSDGLSRLRRAKREISDLLQIMEGDRVGLVAFAGDSFLECPLTLDYAAANLFLEAIDVDLIPIKGTNLADAIRTSLLAFEGEIGDSQAIILITDGEDHGGEAIEAAEEAKERGVRIFPIGIGGASGAPIPAPGGGFRRDRSGEIVLSHLDEPALQKIALLTEGRYVRSVSGDLDLEEIYLQGIKASLEDKELEATRRQRWHERFQWPVGLALICLALEPFISDRRRRET